MSNKKLLKTICITVTYFLFFEQGYIFFENILSNYQKYKLEMHLPHNSVSFAFITDMERSNNWSVKG